jgi:hypothetical protein
LPTLARHIVNLKMQAHELGLPSPPKEVLEDLEWRTKLDQAISDLDDDALPHEKALALAKVYDERYHTDVANHVQRLGSEGAAQGWYERMRPDLYPLLPPIPAPTRSAQ